MTGQYLFGDTELAARRLEVVARAFAPSSRAFAADAAGRRRSFAVDLGCGPGYTTHLLAEASQCRRAVGLDRSAYFVELAEKTATAVVSFRRHDLTSIPFLDGPRDLMYARFLLTHQVEPGALIEAWATQLRPGGRLLVEEVDAIITETPVLVEYLAITEAMLADAGHNLYVGSSLAALPTPDTLVRRSSAVTVVPLADSLAARMFAMNIQTWRHNVFVRDNHSPATIRRLTEALLGIAESPTTVHSTVWRMRQLVFERED